MGEDVCTPQLQFKESQTTISAVPTIQPPISTPWNKLLTKMLDKIKANLKSLIEEICLVIEILRNLEHSNLELI